MTLIRRLAATVGVVCLWTVFPGCTQQGEDSAGEPPVPVAETEGSTESDAAFFEVEEGFALLGLDDFEVFHGKEPGETATWTSDGQTLHCTGQPRGYLYSKRPFRNFTLRLDYRFIPQDGDDEKKRQNSNTGFLVYIAGEHKLWPVSLEVQGKPVDMAPVKANGGAAAIEVEDNEAARDEARLPVGEWNNIEIVSKDGALTSFLNGTKICESEPGELSEGLLGIQSEDFEIEFRNLRIREDQ